MKIIFENDISISICDTKNNNNTRAFMKVLTDDEGIIIGENPNFVKEVEAFAGAGYLDGK
jgi:hypothetical protein